MHLHAVPANLAVPSDAIDPEQSLGRIAVDLPGATAIFRRLKLDFCCGGQVSLRQAVAERSLDLDALLGELAALQRLDHPPAQTDPASLIEHILARYHEVHRQQLPELERMARRVEAVHRQHPDVPAGLADHIEAMHAELLDHMGKEEQMLFPMLQSGKGRWAGGPIGVMRHEHVAHGAALEQLLQLSHEAQPPVDACNTWRALYAGIRQFSEDLVQHIHLENNLLFPKFENA